jgi:hypothetical protein
MATHNTPAVKYSYRKIEFTEALVDHVFAYLSAVTKVRFHRSDNLPDLVNARLPAIPDTAKILIDSGKTMIRRGDSILDALDFDPVELLAKKLSLSLQSGPYAGQPLKPSPPNEMNMSEIIKLFLRTLARADLIPPESSHKALWPEHCKFALAVSHDIDIIRRSTLGSVRLLFDRSLPGGFRAFLDSAGAILPGKRNPYDCVSQWSKLENAYGINSTYFIFCGPRRHRFDPVYDLGMASKALSDIKSNGSEIALHSSIGCYHGDFIAESKKGLDEFTSAVSLGIRPHYLSAFFPEFWNSSALAGFKYSSSLGFDNDIGYFKGIDMPIIPFDKACDKSHEIVEFPIAIMECGLIGKQRADSDEVFHRGMNLIDRASENCSLVVLDWHQRTLYERDYPHWGSLFLRLIEHARSRGGGFIKMPETADRLLTRFKGLE